jgi:putative membrane protein
MPYIPYCGTPPVPGELWQSWNFDPILIAGLLAIAAGYSVGATRSAAIGHWQRRAFFAGWALTALLLVSPLCSLTVALFSARVGQHMLLTLVAAPLIVFGQPLAAARALLGRSTDAPSMTGSPMLATLAFAALLWIWHAPAPYQATLSSDLGYWAMHLSLFGSALWLWQAILTAGASGRWQGVATCAASSVQMGMLGAIITLAPAALYAPHALTTLPWGMTALQDQQLGGLIMWVPGCAVLLVSGVALAARELLAAAAADGAVNDARSRPVL